MRQLALLAYGHNSVHLLRAAEQRSRKQETAGLDGGHVGRRAAAVNLGNSLGKGFLVLQERQHIDEVYPRLREIRIVFYNVFKHIYLNS